MKYLLICFGVFLVLILILIFAPLRIDVEYRNGKLNLKIKCAFIKLRLKDILKKKKQNVKKARHDGTKSETEAEAVGLKKIKKLHTSFNEVKKPLDEALKFIRGRVKFENIYVRIRYGTGNAAATGLIYGAVWALTGSIYAFLCRYFCIEFPRIEQEPIFNGKAFEAEIEGIIVTKPVHIINAAVRILRVYLKYNKEKGES